MFHSPLPIIVHRPAPYSRRCLPRGRVIARRGSPAPSICSTSVALLIFAPISGNVQIGEVLELVGDFVCAVTLLMLAVRYASLWLGVTMLLQAVQFSLHAFYLVMELPHDLIHAWVNNLERGRHHPVASSSGPCWRSAAAGADAREAAERRARRQKRASAVLDFPPCADARTGAFARAGHALPTGRSPSARMGDIAMNTPAKPAMRPARPEFSSGPCAKRPGWSPENLRSAVLGRSHRSKLGKARLQAAIDQTREVLRGPGRLS